MVFIRQSNHNWAAKERRRENETHHGTVMSAHTKQTETAPATHVVAKLTNIVYEEE
jgi:hypothetical protein